MMIARGRVGAEVTEAPSRGRGTAKMVEASRATDQLDVRSGRRRQPTSDRLAGMTKSPAAAALDSIVADVLAPDLKSMGFRKKSRH
jgi:hypothetical protein